MSTRSLDLPDAHLTPSPTRPSRLLSLDLLRGLTIGFMILVNDNGSEEVAYWPLRHAAWNGFTPTDLVFPTFLLVVGISTVLSTASRLARGASRQSLLLHTLRRAVTLFLLGLVVNSFPLFHLATLRFYGVLPRIAICYLCVATFYLIDQGWRSKVCALLAALLGYWILMRLLPVPGYGVPGRDIPLLDHDANLTAWLDRHIFSAPHLYERTRDPEGLLSTIPAVGTCLIGLLTGLWLRTSHALAVKTRAIAVAGVSGLVLGGLWNLSFPINKKLWTSSYVLFAAGWSLLLLALFLWIADLRAQKESPQESRHERSERSPAWTPLLVFGTNAITAYVLSELMAAAFFTIRIGPITLQQWLYHAIYRAIPNAAFASLLYSLGYVALCWVLVYPLYRKRIFLRI
jgi:predicted acyltransferase